MDTYLYFPVLSILPYISVHKCPRCIGNDEFFKCVYFENEAFLDNTDKTLHKAYLLLIVLVCHTIGKSLCNEKLLPSIRIVRNGIFCTFWGTYEPVL